LNIVLK
jgi:hypothetical protein